MLNLVSIQYVYSIAFEKETVLVGMLISAYLWGFEYQKDHFRIGALVLANILIFSLSSDRTVLILASAFHMGLAMIWFTNKTARVLQFSVLVFICIANPHVILAKQISAALLVVTTLCFAFNRSKSAYFLFAL